MSKENIRAIMLGQNKAQQKSKTKKGISTIMFTPSKKDDTDKEPFLSKAGRLAQSFVEGATVPSSVKLFRDLEQVLPQKKGIVFPEQKRPELKGTFGEKAARFAGELIPGAVSGVGAYNLAGPLLGSRIASPILQQLTRGAVAGGVVGGAEGLGAGRPLPEVAKEIGIGAALGGVADVGVSKVASKLAAVKAKRAPVSQPAKSVVDSIVPKPMPSPEPLLLGPGTQFEAGTRTAIKPTGAALETADERLNRIIETIRPDVESRIDQAAKIRMAISEAGALPVESKKSMVDFLAKTLPNVPKSTWQEQKLPQLVEFAESLAKGAEARGMPEIARRVALSKGIDLDFEFALADMPTEQRLAEMAKRNYWAKIIGLGSESGPLTTEVQEPFVRAIPQKEIKSGAAMLYKTQRIVRPETAEWDDAIQRINNIKPNAQNRSAVIAGAKKIASEVAQEAQTSTAVPEAVLAIYPKNGNIREFINRTVSSVEGWLKTKGNPGQQILSMARNVEAIADKETAKWAPQIFDKVAKLSNEEQINLRDVVRGLKNPVNAKVEAAANVVRQYYQERPARIKDAALTLRTVDGTDIPFQEKPNHFPLRLDWKKIEDKAGRIKPDVLQKLVQTGQAKNIQEADRLLKALRKVAFERHATFQHQASKIELPGYEVSPIKALRSDILEAESRIAQAKIYGVKDENLIAQIEQLRPEDQRFALKLADRLRGMDARADVESQLIEGLLNYNVISKLGLAAIPNATQNVNTALMTGTKSLIKGIRAAISNPQEAKEFAVKAGVYLDPANVAKAIAETRGGLGDAASSFLRATGFSMTEYWNRLIALQAGKAWGDDLFQSLKKGNVTWAARLTGKQPDRIRRVLTDAGIDIEGALKRGALTVDELANIGRYVVTRTQFAGSQMDVPLWAGSPWGKVAFQMKRYAFNQGRLLQRELIDESVKFFKSGGKDGSLRAWGPFLTLFPAAGWMVGAVRDWISGKETPMEKIEKLKEAVVDKDAKTLLLEMIEAYTWVGGIGIASDTIKQLSWSEEEVILSLLGPSAGLGKSIFGTIKPAVTAVQRLTTGEDVEPEKLGAAALRSAVRGNLPIFGYPAAKGELPFGIESETLKNIFQP